MGNAELDWHSIVQDVGPSLFRYFSGSFPAQVASDLVQETLIRLVQKQQNGEFDPNRGMIKSYAFGIARYIRFEALKKRSGFDLVDDESLLDNVTAEQEVDRTDRVALLRWAIKKLKPIEQELILLMIDADSSLDQAARHLNIPIGTAKSHVHRAKEKLRQIMEVQL